MHLVNTEPVTAVQRVIGKRLYTDPASRVSIYLECKAFRQRRGIFKVRLFCLVQLRNVFMRPSSTVHTNQHSVVVFLYNCVENARCTVVFVSVFIKYRVDYCLCGSLFKITDI